MRSWRRSLQVQVVTTTFVISLIAMTAIGGYITSSIQESLFAQRLDQILVESAQATEQAQAQFDSATAGSSAQVQQLLNDIVARMRTTGTGNREVFLWRPEGVDTTTSVIDLSTAQELGVLISPELRAQTIQSTGQFWQSVAIPGEDGPEPGIVVGSVVEVPLAGPFELYYLHSLELEQRTLTSIQRILAIGAVTLVALVVLITAVVARTAVRPVRQAARVAERLADGHLDERMAVRGQTEMATLARSFNEMSASLQDQIERMESLSALQRRFVSDVSHELRTPLTTIRMAGEVLHGASADFAPPTRRSAELLTLQLDRFEDLLADLLEISRFDAGAATLDAERRDLRDLTDRALDQAADLAAAKGVWLSVVYPADPAIVDADPRRVERVIRNLLVNAIEHAEGGPVEVTVAASPTAVAVTVRDFGVGISPQDAEHVFDRFWRADPARARTSGGTGLGLAISLEDARLHGGWLEAWGRPGMGASFRLTLPTRAGIVLTDSPLPLVPESSRPRAAGITERVVTGAIPVVRPDAHGPSAVPDLTAFEEPE